MNPYLLSIPGTLRLETGPASIISPTHIDFLEYAPTDEDHVVCQVDDEHEAGRHLSYFVGDFSGFHLYAIATHTKILIQPDSVRQSSASEFEAILDFCSESGEPQSRLTRFRSPHLGAVSVSATRYGVDLSAFSLRIGDGSEQKYQCDLSFLAHYSDFPAMLRIEYVGMAAKNGRTANKRLADGHVKLQKILSQLQSYNSFRTASLLLYKPGRLVGTDLKFDDVVETLEASLIQYFKPKPLNIEHLNFPDGNTDLVKKLRRNDVQRISVQIEAPTGCRIYSRHCSKERSIHELSVEIPQGRAKSNAVPRPKKK